MRTIPFNTAYKYSAKDFGAQGCYVVGAPDVLAGSRAGELADRLTPLLAQGRRVLLLAKYNGTLPDPPAALDPATAEKVLELTRRVVAESHITCLMVTHNMHQALELGNRTLMMADGHIVLDVAGSERAGMGVDDLIARFKAGAGHELDNDRILLSE